MKKLHRRHGLNCMDTHVLEVIYNGGLLQYGWAKGPEDVRYQHVWVLRGGRIVDLFNWTEHEPQGFRDMPPYSRTAELRQYVLDNQIEWSE